MRDGKILARLGGCMSGFEAENDVKEDVGVLVLCVNKNLTY